MSSSNSPSARDTTDTVCPAPATRRSDAASGGSMRVVTHTSVAPYGNRCASVSITRSSGVGVIGPITASASSDRISCSELRPTGTRIGRSLSGYDPLATSPIAYPDSNP